MSQHSPIALLVCGGTLDKDYDPIQGQLVFEHTHLPQLLQEANHQLTLRIEMVMLKDSLDMDAQDRQTLLQACIAAPESHLVITHGTDTMTESARVLLSHLPQLSNKTLVFTGAMRPFRLGQSDAGFNLGSALMAAQLAEPGIYLAMNGRLLSADKAIKNRRLGLFETIQNT